MSLCRFFQQQSSNRFAKIAPFRGCRCGKDKQKWDIRKRAVNAAPVLPDFSLYN